MIEPEHISVLFSEGESARILCQDSIQKRAIAFENHLFGRAFCVKTFGHGREPLS
jgi:hypothetical protein